MWFIFRDEHIFFHKEGDMHLQITNEIVGIFSRQFFRAVLN